MWINDDICFCGNAYECPHKNDCRRAERKPGIHSYSNFYNEKNKECEYFWKKENKEIKFINGNI